MRHLNNSQWWFLLIVALLIVFLWPPRDNKSLAIKFVNWAVDPWDQLPPPVGPLPLRAGDDPYAVEAHDILMQQYEMLYNKGGWTRMRLRLKVAESPFDPSTVRQLLTGIAVIGVFVASRCGRSKE